MTHDKRWPVEVVLEHDVVDLKGARAQIRTLNGRECISQLFHFDLHVVSLQPLDITRLLAGESELRFERREQDGTGPSKVERQIRGTLSHVRDRLTGRGGYHEYIVQFVPLLWKTTLTVTSDVYLDLSVPKIIEKILTDFHGFEKGRQFDMRLNEADYPPRDFVVQYQESYLDFISRLCEHVGIFFYFTWNEAQSTTTVVFADSNDKLAIAEPKKVWFEPRGERSHVFALETAVRQVTRNYHVRDHNYRMPKDIELGSSASLQAAAQFGDHYEFGGHFKDPKEAAHLARVRAEQVGAEAQVFEGASDYPGLAAGATMEIDNHPHEELTKGEMVLTEVVHRASQVVGTAQGIDEAPYENEFFAIMKSVPYRPPLLTRKPVVPGIVTALVETAGDKEVGAVDEHGLYNLNFHYDSRFNAERKPREIGKTSKPVRMAQPNAGVNRKLHFPLADASEVVVGFVNGDPDRPIILGAVPSLAQGKGVRESPVTVANNAKLIFRSNENEMSVFDKKGMERWRTQVADWSHVQLIGMNEGTDDQDKGARTHIREDGFAHASVANYTATVNEGMTFESKLQTSLQQTQTVLTATKVVEFVGEDPGWDDWKKFDEALAKAEKYARLAVELAAEQSKQQAAVAKDRADEADKDHAQAKKEAQAETGNEDLGQARADNDKKHKETSEKAEKACAEEEQKKKEHDDLVKQRDDKRAEERKADGDRRRAKAENAAIDRETKAAENRERTATTDAERRVAKGDVDAAKRKKQPAETRLSDASAAYDKAHEERVALDKQVAEKKKEADAAYAACNKARNEHREEERKKKALEREEKASEKKDKAAARAQKAEEAYKRLDAKVEQGKAEEIEKAKDPEEKKKAEKKDLWSKVAQDLSDEAHKQHLADTRAALDDAKASLDASTQREDGDGGAFAEPYSIRVSKDSLGLVAHKNAFMYGDQHATVYSHKHAHLISQDQAHVKADKGVEIATNDWIKITSTKVIDLQCDKDIQLVADSAENKSMPGGHSMLFYSNKGINMESATGSIEGKAMKSIKLEASTTGIEIKASLANVDIKATAGQLKGMGTAGIDFSTPAMFGAKAGGMVTMSAGGMMSLKAGGLVDVTAGGAIMLKAAGLVDLTAGGAVTIKGPAIALIAAGVALV